MGFGAAVEDGLCVGEGVTVGGVTADSVWDGVLVEVPVCPSAAAESSACPPDAGVVDAGGVAEVVVAGAGFVVVGVVGAAVTGFVVDAAEAVEAGAVGLDVAAPVVPLGA